MREICSYGSVGVPAGNRRHYPAPLACLGLATADNVRNTVRTAENACHFIKMG